MSIITVIVLITVTVHFLASGSVKIIFNNSKTLILTKYKFCAKRWIEMTSAKTNRSTLSAANHKVSF